ncbi:MAG: cysteine desulfurase [Vampirovibrio sp.]|nr:cysteine desulfurase [Vampirovibrio sp.]
MTASVLTPAQNSVITSVSGFQFSTSSLTQAEVLQLKADFPVLAETVNGKSLVYLDNGATTQKPWAVINRLNQFYAHENGTVRRGVYKLAEGATTAFDAVREQVAGFINAKSSTEIVFVRGCTEAINLVATTFGKAHLQAGDEILVTAMEHHANFVPWQQVYLERGCTLKVIPMSDAGELDMQAYAHLLQSGKVKLVGVIHVSNVLGTINPVAEMAKMAHAVGAKILVDGAQSAPHMPIDVQALDCDFFTFSGHKLYGPTGVGVLYGKYEVLETLPPYQFGGDMIDVVSLEKTTFLAPPLRFEAGTPAIAQVIGLGTAIGYLQAIGLERIALYEETLRQQATDALLAIEGLTLYGQAKHKAAVCSFLLEGIHAFDIGTLADLEGIAIRTGHHCAQPLMKRLNVSATARATFGFYNTHEDIDRLVVALHKVIKLCK